MGSVRVEDLKYPHIIVVGFDTFMLFYCDPEQAVGDVKGSGNDVVEAQLGFQLCFIEGKFAGAQLLGIVTPVPWSHLVIVT